MEDKEKEGSGEAGSGSGSGVAEVRGVSDEEKKVKTEIEGGNGKSILKGPSSSSQSKKHFIDAFDLGLSKKLKFNFAVTPPAKSSTRKNFIQKNIKINTHHPPLPKPHVIQDDSLITELLEEGQRKKNLDIKERFYDKAESYKKKKEDLKDKFDKEELSACTFQPKTNNKEKPSSKPSIFNAKVDEYVNRQRKNKEKAIEDSKRLAEKAENDEQLSYKPTICERSKEILLKKQPQEGPIYERLYNIGKGQANSDVQADPKKLNEDPEIFFHPTINEKSRNLIRPDRIENILYDDAKRRKNNPPQLAKSPTARFMGTNSEKVLIDKFKREFLDVLSEVMIDIELANYSKLTEIFKSLHFIRDDKEDIDKTQVLTLWRSLIDTDTGSIQKTEVLSISLSIMGFFEDWMTLDTQSFKITKEDVQKIHKKYEQLYKNRTLVKLKSSANQSFKNTVDYYTFQPEIIAQSNELSEKWRSTHREPGSIEQSLLADKLKKDKKLSKLKEQIEQEKLRECSFKPKTEELPKSYIKSERVFDVEGKSTHKGLELYTLASKNKEKKDKLRTSKEIQEEKELGECTFKPSILEKTTGNFPSFYQRLEINSELREKQVLSPSSNKKLVSPRNNTKKVVPALNSPPKTFSSTENLQTIKETLEDDLSPKPDFLNSELEAFEKAEEMILSESLNQSAQSLAPETQLTLTNPETEAPISE